MKTSSEILQELATEVSNNQHELEHDGMAYTDARLADDEAITDANQALCDALIALVGPDGDLHSTANPTMTEIQYDSAQLGINNERERIRQSIRAFFNQGDKGGKS